MIVRTITLGKEGKNIFPRIRNESPQTNVPKAMRFV
jgi:hypothetical protein